MAKHLKCTTDNGEPDAQTVAAFGRKAREGFEDPGQLRFRNADARIVHIDSDFVAFAATADQDASSRLCVSYGIGQQIADDAIE